MLIYSCLVTRPATRHQPAPLHRDQWHWRLCSLLACCVPSTQFLPYTMARAVGAFVISPTRLRKVNFRAKIVNIHNIKIFTIFALLSLCAGVSGK